MRPTGKLHLGNYVGALQNWIRLQNEGGYHCFFFVADWHALTTDYADTSRLFDNTREVLLDWLAAGLDPHKCTMFIQSQVLQHSELHILFSMITPLSWLERVPTYKEQQQNLDTKDLSTYGFLGYPLLQAADILVYRAAFVPVGEDQIAHVELTREVARRFNVFFPKSGNSSRYSFSVGAGSLPNSLSEHVFPEPQPLLTKTPKLLGTDKRKMSKSYGNTILLSEEVDKLAEKVKNSVTDRPRLSDKGNPDRCPVGNLHQIFSDSYRLNQITEGCMQATIRCFDCKALAIESVNEHLNPIRERRKHFAQQPELVREIVRRGNEEATVAAEETMRHVRDAVGTFSFTSSRYHSSTKVDDFRLRVPEAVLWTNEFEKRYELRTTEWLEKISKLYPLRKDKPWTFITPRGRKVGIHTAAEKESGRWTFKVRDRALNVLVLLAQDQNRYLYDYVLPPKILQFYWKGFQRNEGNAIIEIEKVAEDVFLFTHEGSIPIQQYLGDYSALQ
jgi:tryptophanyl-tRNA synthetase